jgi:uncharacterized cupredoxin-like copper-binding protein
MREKSYDHDVVEVRAGATVGFVIHNRGQRVHEIDVATHDVHRDHRVERLETMIGGATTPARMEEGSRLSRTPAHRY